MRMTTVCVGCRWIDDKIRQRRALAHRLNAAGENDLARLVEQAIESLFDDRRAHVARDHAVTPRCPEDRFEEGEDSKPDSELASPAL